MSITGVENENDEGYPILPDCQVPLFSQLFFPGEFLQLSQSKPTNWDGLPQEN